MFFELFHSVWPPSDFPIWQQEASASFCQVEFIFHGYQFECPTSFTTGPFAVLGGAAAALEGGAAHHSRLDASAASGQQGGGFVI